MARYAEKGVNARRIINKIGSGGMRWVKSEAERQKKNSTTSDERSNEKAKKTANQVIEANESLSGIIAEVTIGETYNILS